jgi:hypothetical protein
LAKLYECELLPEDQRIQARDEISRLAVETPDSDWLPSGPIATFLSDQERAAILARVRDELIPDLDEMLDNWRWNEQGDSAEEYYRPLEDALKDYAAALSNDHAATEALAAALERVDYLRTEASHWRKDDEGDDQSPKPTDARPKPTNLTDPAQKAVDQRSGRYVFDDVDQ